MSFFDFCVFSKTIHRGTLVFTSNDAEYMICYQCSIDKNGLSSTENKLFTVEKRDFHKLLDMMSQTSKNTDAMKFTCFQSLFRLKTSIYAL